LLFLTCTETARFLQQDSTIRLCRVVLIYPSHSKALGDSQSVAESLERWVCWLELRP
jgi:hypothetical protein